MDVAIADSTARAARGASGRARACRLLEQLAGAWGREATDDELRRDAWIVAPHPDDEVLGCGGTIARKMTLGARVRVICLTDGTGSHARWMDRSTLRATRRAETRAACRALGMADADVAFLDLEDGALSRDLRAAARVLATLLEAAPGDEVYAPSHREAHDDHRAACRIVRTVLASIAARPAYREYNVWTWHEWPWVSAPSDRRGARRLAWTVRGALRSTALVGTSRYHVAIHSVLNRKRRALAAHTSQVHGVRDAGPKLSDVAEGEFLRRLLRPYEMFRAYTTLPSPAADGLDALGTRGRRSKGTT